MPLRFSLSSSFPTSFYGMMWMSDVGSGLGLDASVSTLETVSRRSSASARSRHGVGTPRPRLELWRPWTRSHLELSTRRSRPSRSRSRLKGLVHIPVTNDDQLSPQCAHIMPVSLTGWLLVCIYLHQTVMYGLIRSRRAALVLHIYNLRNRVPLPGKDGSISKFQFRYDIHMILTKYREIDMISISYK